MNFNMGLPKLNSVVKRYAPHACKEVPLEKLVPGVYGVDVSIYLYPSKYNSANKGKGSHIRKFMDMITNWRAAGHRLVMVFDGNTGGVKAKQETIRQRREIREKKDREIIDMCTEFNTINTTNELSQEELESINIVPVSRKELVEQALKSSTLSTEQRIELEQAMSKTIDITSQDLVDLRNLFDMTGTPYIQAEGEADHMLADLYKHGLIQGVISEDGDMLTHGVDWLIKGLIDAECLRAGVVRVYDLKSLLYGMGLTYEQFVDVCIIVGCDYCPPLKNISWVNATAQVKKYASLSKFIEAQQSGESTYKLGAEIPDNYLEIAEEAARIFLTQQEDVPESEVWKDWAELQCRGYVSSELSGWLAKNTNYTSNTIRKKEAILTTVIDVKEQELSSSGIIKQAPKLKLTVKAKTNVSNPSLSAGEDVNKTHVKPKLVIKRKSSAVQNN